MNRILRCFDPRFLRSIIKHDPTVQGIVSLETREGGKLRQRRHGKNIWTLTGREHIVELISLKSNNDRTTWRDDRVGYVGLGTGSQPEVAAVTSLVTPVVYKTGEFLAQLVAPVTFPSSSEKTAVQFIREFGKSEVSLGYDVIITEAGLFSDGDPEDNWDLDDLPTDFASAAGRAPDAYKTIEPITKTIDFTLRLVWEFRVL